jgi:hypothetical protein
MTYEKAIEAVNEGYAATYDAWTGIYFIALASAPPQINQYNWDQTVSQAPYVPTEQDEENITWIKGSNRPPVE